MILPYDDHLLSPESLLAWVKQEGVILDIRTLEGYPQRPLLFSEYLLEPPTIIIYRYPAAEPWLNLLSQHTVQYYGPWYFLHIAFRFYCHLEMNGHYEIERTWRHRLFGRLSTLDERAYSFTQKILGTLKNPLEFDVAIEKSYHPGV